MTTMTTHGTEPDEPIEPTRESATPDGATDDAAPAGVSEIELDVADVAPPTDPVAPPVDSGLLPSNQNPILRGRNLSRTFTVGPREIPVLREVDVDVAAGEMLVILGRSGAGKSTLLHLLGLLDTPSAGTIEFDSVDLASLNPERQSQVRNTRFGFVFQFYHLLPEFTALENVLMPVMIRTGPVQYLGSRRKVRDRAKALLTDLGLGHRLNHRPTQLSGGERQRVAIARALINDPAIVFCDEPSGNLDSRTATEIHELLVSLNGAGQTFVIVTHNDRLMDLGTRRLWMNDGRIYADPNAIPAAV